MFCERLQNIFGISMVPHYLQILLTISVENSFGSFWNLLAVFYLTKLNRFYNHWLKISIFEPEILSLHFLPILVHFPLCV
jgi:hypothetical protein